MHHEMIGFSATQPNTGLAATAYSGDSLQVRNGSPGKKVRLLNVSINKQVAGNVAITFPSANDTTRGINVIDQITNPLPLIGWPPTQYLQPQEQISINVVGSNVAGDFEQGVLYMWYEDVPGLTGTWLTADQVAEQRIRMVTVRGSITALATGGWSGAAALNASPFLLRANTNYAIIGGVVQARCNALGIRSPDWSNVRVGFPGNSTRADLTGDWFSMLSTRSGLPLIPVFNSANAGAIQIDVGQDENAAAVPFSLNLVELLTQGVNTDQRTP